MLELHGCVVLAANHGHVIVSNCARIRSVSAAENRRAVGALVEAASVEAEQTPRVLPDAGRRHVDVPLLARVADRAAEVVGWKTDNRAIASAAVVEILQ